MSAEMPGDGTDPGARSVEDESRLLVEALRRARSGAPTPDRAVKDPESARPLRLVGDGVDADDTGHECGQDGGQNHSESETACASCPWSRADAWRKAHGPSLLRGLADVAVLAADGLTALATAWESQSRAEADDAIGSAHTQDGQTRGEDQGRSGNLPHSSPLGDKDDVFPDEHQERA